MDWADTINRSQREAQVLKRFVFFGDSVCIGQGVSIHKGWVTRIAARINAYGEKNGADLLVVNASINGNTTRQALERMPYDVQSHGVDILLTQFGMNDCNYWETDRGLSRVSPKAFTANLEEIVARAFNFGARVVMINTNHPTILTQKPLSGTTLTYEESNRRYNQLIREMASGLGDNVILNDVEREFTRHIEEGTDKLEDFLLPDGFHPSIRGHDLYFELIAPVVDEVMRDLIDSGPVAPRETAV